MSPETGGRGMPHGSVYRLVPDFRVSIAGKKLDVEKDAALVRVDVDLDADLFGQCVLTFNDPKLALINGKDLDCGTAVKVEAGFHTRLKQIFEGEVVALEPLFRRDTPPALKVVCLETLHRLALSQMTRAFNNVDDKEIATSIARDHGLTAQAPSGSKEHVAQGNVSDAAFLRRLAAKSGNALRIEGKKLIIGPPAKGADVQVLPGDGLAKLRVRIQSNTQVGEVTVHGWDAKAKREIVGKAQPAGDTQQGAKDHGGGSTLSIAGHETVPADVATAESMAKGRLRKIAEGFVRADGDLIGNPDVIPGAVLDLDKLGAEIDGQYRVDHATHAISKHGYLVRFRAVRIARKKPPKPARPVQAQPGSEPGPEDVHLIFLEVKAIGGTPLVDHLVLILDAQTGERVGDPVKTDEKGILRAEVPDPKKKYRVEIVDEKIEHPAPALHTEQAALLICHFVELDGTPVANEKVEGKSGDGKFELTTDENGRIEAPAHLEAYELTIRKETFTAHALPAKDKEKEEGLYRFVLGEAAPKDVHLLVSEVKGIGDTPLVDHAVRVIDPDNGAEAAYGVTDAKGVVRVEVPENKSYRIEVVDEDSDHPAAALHMGDEQAMLICHFVDSSGGPIANEKVQGKSGDETFELTTDDDGRLTTHARLQAYELTVRGESFTAHALPLKDKEKEEGLYRFVLGETGPADVHMLVTEVKSIGDTPLVSHPVRVLDPESGAEVAYAVTDAKGVVQVEVPENKNYRIEIVDEESEHAAQPLHPDDQAAVLICHFVDEAGNPIANETIEASGEGDTFELRTDENGRVESPAHLAAYRLKIRGQTFTAHALLARDREREESLYRFIVPGQGGEPAT